jgi:hypothetical protein
MKIGLVACGARKLSRTTPARELYTGTLFRLASEYAERTCDRWYILSGKHGLVSPETELLPYDSRFLQMSADWRWAWAGGVLAELEALHLNRSDDGHVHWLLLAGEKFRQFLADDLVGTVESPLAGLGIGRQIVQLKQLLAEAE